jgi:hypothetical protein
MVSMLGAQNVVFMDTFHPQYAQTRKVLSAAFFKQKLRAITQVIKMEIIDSIKELQRKEEHVVNIIDFWSVIENKIFTSIAVGRSNSSVLCNYELEDGTFVRKTIGYMVRQLI